MRTTRRRATVLATAATAALALTLGACSGGDSSDESTADTSELGQVGAMADYGVGTTFKATEPVTFGLLYRDHPNYPLKNDWEIFTKLKENQNVSFDIVSAPLSDWENRKSLLIGAGDAPDIISVTYPGQEVPFVAGGAILPISDYLELMPNFQEKIKDWGLESDLDQIRQEDGKFYVLPGLRESVRPMYTYAVRTDIWDELGLSYEPATYEEFAQDLAKVKAAHPEIAYPLSDRWSANGPIEASLNVAAPAFGTAAGWGYGEGVWWDGKEYVYTGATDEYRSLLEYFHGLVEDGLMDPESLTQQDDQAIQKLGSGQSAAIGTNDQEIVRYRTTFAELGNTADVKMIRVPGGPDGDNLAAGGRLVSGIMVSSEAAKKDSFTAMLQFIDWLYYSDEGLEFAKWGVEGDTYTKDASGTRTLMPEIDYNGLNPSGTKKLNVDYGFANGVFMLEHGSTDDLDRSMLRPEVVEFVESMQDKDQLQYGPPRPLDELEREQVSLYQTALKDHVWQNTAKFILGQRSFDEWDAYVSELKGKNMDQYLQVVNGAQQRYADANG